MTPLPPPKGSNQTEDALVLQQQQQKQKQGRQKAQAKQQNKKRFVFDSVDLQLYLAVSRFQTTIDLTLSNYT